MLLKFLLSCNIENKIYLKQGGRSPGEKSRENDRLSFPFSVSNQEQTHRKRQAAAEIPTQCIISSLGRLCFAHQLSLQATLDGAFMNLKFYGNIIGIVVFQIVFCVHLVLTGLFHEWFLILHTGAFGCTLREGNANIQMMAMHCRRSGRAEMRKLLKLSKSMQLRGWWKSGDIRILRWRQCD